MDFLDYYDANWELEKKSGDERMSFEHFDSPYLLVLRQAVNTAFPSMFCHGNGIAACMFIEFWDCISSAVEPMQLHVEDVLLSIYA